MGMKMMGQRALGDRTGSARCPGCIHHRNTVNSNFKPRILLARVGRRSVLVHAVAANVAFYQPAVDVHGLFDSGFFSEFEYKKNVGCGSFGEVWLAEDLMTGENVAVKELRKRRGHLTVERTLQKIANECRVMTDLRNCSESVNFVKAFNDEDFARIVMEFCSGQDLKHQLSRHGPFSEQLAAAVCYEILKVIRACHDSGVVHGDVKTANFILKSDKCNPFRDRGITKLANGWLKAIDFGCSQYMNECRTSRIRSRVGTPVYMAPEVFSRNYGLECDLWSLGVVLYQLLAKTFPFWETPDRAMVCTVAEVEATVTTHPVVFSQSVWQQVSPACLDFLSKLLEKDFRKRITVEEAQTHPWICENVLIDQNGGVILRANNIVSCSLEGKSVSSQGCELCL